MLINTNRRALRPSNCFTSVRYCGKMYIRHLFSNSGFQKCYRSFSGIGIEHLKSCFHFVFIECRTLCEKVGLQ